MRKLKFLWTEKIALWIAFRLPKRVVLWCFIRVHSLSGEAPCDGYKKAYDLACDKWRMSP